MPPGFREFYQRALDFACSRTGRRSEPEFERRRAGTAGRRSITLALGARDCRTLAIRSTGAALSQPRHCPRIFAFSILRLWLRIWRWPIGRLCSVDGWTAISTDGPQRLPPSSGGVAAFKFRDPDGHPLELLAFPDRKWPAHWQSPAERRSLSRHRPFGDQRFRQRPQYCVLPGAGFAGRGAFAQQRLRAGAS